MKTNMYCRSIRALRVIKSTFALKSKIQTIESVRHNLCCSNNIIRTSVGFSTTAKMDEKEKLSKAEAEITSNPFFEKYKAKIQHMQSTNPEEYEEKLKELAERFQQPTSSSPVDDSKTAANEAAKPTTGSSVHKVVVPSDTAKAGVGMTRQKGLDSVMKVELLKDRTAEEITQIWNEYHKGKDCVYTVLKAEEFNNLMKKSKECPVFVYPIPREDGFEFILAQFDRFDVYFTPLGMFQLVRENAPPCLTVTHYTELLEEKGIVLMVGQFDDKVLKHTLALSLVQQMSIFYGKESKFYELVRRFNHTPEEFKYEEVIEALKSLPQCDLK